MTPERYAAAREIFYQAEELPVDEQLAFVEQQTSDPELRQEVMSLLQYHDADAAVEEGATVKGEGGRTVVSGPAAATPASLADLPSAIRVARGSQISAASSIKRRRWLPLALSIAVALPSLLAVYGVERKAKASLEASRSAQLKTLGDTAALAVHEWAQGKMEIARSWARLPQLQFSVEELVQLGRQKDPRETLLRSSARDDIHQQMTALGGQGVRYVFWDRNGTTLASWQADAADVGNPIPADATPELSRAFAGQTLIHKPDYVEHRTEGFSPETAQPLMWLLTPVLDANGKPQAVMLLRGIGLYEELTHIFDRLDFESTGDTYLVDDRGRLRSEVRHTADLIEAGLLPDTATSAAIVFRAGDPGHLVSQRQPLRQDAETLPLTIAVSHAAARKNGQTVQAYRDYRGVKVIGAWRWLPDLELGTVAEISVEEAFAPRGLLRWSLLGLAAVMTLTAAATGLVVDQRFRSVRKTDAEQFGRYELIEELGSGGMGVVYRARHQLMKRPAALKVIRPDRFDDENTLRFDREVQLAAGLRSLHSVSVFDYGWTSDGRAYCAMELLDGMTVHQAIGRSGPMPAGRVVRLMMHLCDSLSEAHAMGLVHRDVKPRNVMVSPQGDRNDWAVLFDFGLAKSVEPDENLFMTQERIWAGTPMFMAPERFRNPGRTDPRSDIYSLGAVGYFMLAGKEPFSEIDPSGMFELILSSSPVPLHELIDLPEVSLLSELIHRCMDRNPEARPQTAEEVRVELAKIEDLYDWTRHQARQWWATFG